MLKALLFSITAMLGIYSQALCQRFSTLAIDLQAGLSMSHTDHQQSGLGYSYLLALENGLSKSVAFRMEAGFGLLLAGKASDTLSFNNQYNTVGFAGRVYLSNLVGLNDSLNKINLFLDAGASMIYSNARLGQDDAEQLARYETGDFCFPLGIGLALPVGRGMDLSLQYRYLLTTTDWLDGWDPDVLGSSGNDAISTFNLGLSIKLNAKGERALCWPGAYRDRKAERLMADSLMEASSQHSEAEYLGPDLDYTTPTEEKQPEAEKKKERRRKKRKAGREEEATKEK